MRRVAFPLALAIAVTGLIALLLFGGDGGILGLDDERFADLAKMGAIALVIGAALIGGRGRFSPRLWHAAVWLALVVALMAGWQIAHG